MRKPWMSKMVGPYRFTSDGCMTQCTAAAWRARKDFIPAGADDYARALGISVEEARERIAQQEANLKVEEIQDSLI